MEKYITPEMDVIDIKNADIITDSDCIDIPGGDTSMPSVCE